MLNPDTIVDAVVTAIQSIEPVVAAMAGDPARISSFKYLYGVDMPLLQAILQMKAPSIMVVWEATMPGNFDGMTIWKHRVAVYLRVANVAGTPQPTSYANLWWLIVNSPVNGGSQNIRSVELIAPYTEIMDTPGIEHHLDEDGMDYFCGKFVIPEKGDN